MKTLEYMYHAQHLAHGQILGPTLWTEVYIYISSKGVIRLKWRERDMFPTVLGIYVEISDKVKIYKHKNGVRFVS